MRFIAVFIFFVSSFLSAQVLNTAHMLPKEAVTIGFAPVISNNAVFYYSQVNYGLTRNAAVEGVVGFPSSGTYVGMNGRFIVAYNPDLTVTIGGHVRGSVVGVNGTLNLSIPLTRKFSVYIGADADIDFISSTTMQKPAWGFLGISNKFGQIVEILVEINPAITPEAQNIAGACLKLYL